MQCFVLSTLRIKKLREFDACAFRYLEVENMNFRLVEMNLTSMMLNFLFPVALTSCDACVLYLWSVVKFCNQC